jgi:hypothetical protein
MTRYSNPLPHNQVPPNQVHHSQGRPVGAGQQQPGYAYPPQPEHEQAGWPQQGVPRTGGRPAAPGGYNDPGYGAEPTTHHDPYAALRPDGYGYAQPAQPVADPYGLAGYTAPQPPVGQSFGTRQSPPQPSYDAYGSPAGDPYGNNGAYGFGGQPAAPAFGAKPAAPAPQAPSFGSYGAQPGLQPQAPQYAGGYPSQAPVNGYAPPNPLADQWGGQGLGVGQSLALDPRDYDGHGYANPGLGNAAMGVQGQWGGDVYGDPQMDPALAQGYANGQEGYANGQQPQASFDQSYADDDQYEDEPRRSSWKKVAMLVASTVIVGGGLVFAYGSIMGPNTSGPTPLVKGATGPAKVKPSEPGGKQFAHADSKIMGRLGEGGQGEPDAGGVRKVPVVVVGRDGSIQAPPAAAPAEETRAVVSVPGLTVIDGLGGNGPSPSRPAGPSAQQQQAAASPPVQMAKASERPIVVGPPPQPPAKKANNLVAAADMSAPAAVQTKATVVPPKKERVAAADPVVTGPKPTGAGYVAVLASVPASNSSRIDALKQFADMQQKYGTILQNKTPDVQEANLGEKGTYHRLLVGPPGSRDSASSVCVQLKAEGYSGCWVTAY